MALIGTLLLLAIGLLAYSRFTRPPFPPGPKPLPIIGNILDITTKELWLTAFKWARTYGPVTHIRIFNQSLVFLNTPKVVFDLLDRRGSIYSDKPHLIMAGELCGCENMAAFTPYGDRARRQRKLMQKAFGPAVIPRYHDLMQMESRPFLSRLVTSPLQFQEHIRRYAGGLTLLVVYGHQVKSNDDPFLTLAEECVDILANRIASGGGIWPVDIFPALKHLPLWFPGTSFKRNAQIWKAKMEEFVDRPYEFVKSEIKKGTARPSFVSTLLELPKVSSSPLDASFDSTTTTDDEVSSSDYDFSFSSDDTEVAKDIITDDHDHDIRWTANSMYSASIDTTITTLSHFILAMVQHPHVLQRAQEELDNVLRSRGDGLGSSQSVADRLPTFEDRAKLPYCDAVFTETLRWGVPVPLSLPHRLTQPDTYEGMYIPQGSLVFGNIWAIMRDPGLYQDPEVFEPERWLADVIVGGMGKGMDVDVGEGGGGEEEEAGKARDPRAFVFGFGRRRCPGTHLVESSIWLLITSMLATLDIRKARDEKGVEIEPVVKFENAVFRTPSPFVCDIRPRSEEALRLIMEE